MSTSVTSVTAAEIMDRSAVLMNDPAKTDYTYDALMPLLRMALDELNESLTDAQSSPTTATVVGIIVPVGITGLYPVDSLNEPHYPPDLIEIQEVAERRAGTEDHFVPLKRDEYLQTFEARDGFMHYTWENQIIKFNPKGARTLREIRLMYIRNFTSTVLSPETLVGTNSSRSYLSFKTAAYAAMFIGENPTRAQVLDAQAEKAMEKIESINNKGRQQITTRHRPFRAAFKARGGF